jgi:hypothetical protein
MIGPLLTWKKRSAPVTAITAKAAATKGERNVFSTRGSFIVA